MTTSLQTRRALGLETTRVVRLDIQALRAAAVALVVMYHVAPRMVPGGFVGVDAFFAISGFLITTMLIEHPPTTLKGLADFWARRIRRLLPAALLVLAVIVAAAWSLLPATQWQSTASQVRASTLYVVNWALIRDAIDYLASAQAPTPVQHFWSLAVEEQFYVVWPILILVLTLIAPQKRRRLTYAAGLGVVVLASLAYSIHATSTDPAVAYFSTLTRMWELGLGGLLALAAPALAGRLADPRLRGVLAAQGWAILVLTGLIYSDKTPFPGWQAAFPVAGSLLVIAAQSDFEWYAARPVHWLGDVSYSVYLWHWPLTIFLPLALARFAPDWPGMKILEVVVIISATLLLAGLSKALVEDRFRTTTWKGRPRATYALAITSMAVVVALASGLTLELQHRQQQDRRTLNFALTSSNPCLGAGAMDTRLHCPTPHGALIPSPALAAKDLSPSYRDQVDGDDCLARPKKFKVRTCSYSVPGYRTNVVLVGNSHAAHWVPALLEITKARRWHLTTYIAASCPGSDSVPAFNKHKTSKHCARWARQVVDAIKTKRPDLIIFASHVARRAWGADDLRESYPIFEDGFRRTLQDLSSSGRPVVVIRDTPKPNEDDDFDLVPDCVEENPTDLAVCAGPRAEWIPVDPAALAAQALHRRNVAVVDLDNYFCDRKTCFSTIGGVIVYSDGNHMTATYSRTLAPYLDMALAKALPHMAASHGA